MESQESKQSKNFSDIETATERSLTISEKEKSNGIIAYITIIGLIIAFVQNQEEKSEYVNFHVRQMIGLALIGIAVSWIPFVGWIIGLATIVFWIIGLMGAMNGERKPVPIVGEHFQEWFKSVGA
ncbi:DUF4870 domain-containing protein [Bernardetia sp. OM2101]|uniref:DUF4870 domain-containing protein n=1 Tax=Bernardetia sp. OM2101 TaxID=3344876 RepID=UPI0035CFA4C1